MAQRSSSNSGKVWKFVHRQDEYIHTNLTGISYRHPDGWIEIHPDGRIDLNTSCMNGYAWDGCTPKKEILDFVIGTPDGRLDYITEQPLTYYASMTHDMIYQFKEDIPMSRYAADRLFYLIMRQAGFKWSGIYYRTVRLFGGLYGSWHTAEVPRDLIIYRCSWIERAFIKAQQLHVVQHPYVEIAQSYKNIE